MQHHVLLTRYEPEVFLPLVENILGVRFAQMPICVGTRISRMHVAEEGRRLLFLHERDAGLPPPLAEVARKAPDMDVRCVLVGNYARSAFPAPAAFERDAEADIGQVMLNLVDDPGAVVWAHLPDAAPPGGDHRPVVYERYVPRIDHRTGAQMIDPITTEIGIDLGDA